MLWHWVFVIVCVCVCVYVCISLAPILEPKRWAVWVWALWGRILGVMANTILFANSSDYCSSGYQDPNKQIIPKTNASTHSCPSRADYAAVAVCVRLYMCMCERIECMHICMDYVVQEHSLKLCFPCNIMPYSSSIHHPFLIEWDICEHKGGIESRLRNLLQ